MEGKLLCLLHVVKDGKFAVYDDVKLADEVIEELSFVFLDGFLRSLLRAPIGSDRRRRRFL